MLKEIFEQPAVIGDTISALIRSDYTPNLPTMPFSWAKVPRVKSPAAAPPIMQASSPSTGSSNWRHAGRNRCRFRIPLPRSADAEGGVTLAISQSGETADTLAALDYAKKQKQKIVSVLNAPHSSMARLSDVVVPTRAGPKSASLRPKPTRRS